MSTVALPTARSRRRRLCLRHECSSRCRLFRRQPLRSARSGEPPCSHRESRSFPQETLHVSCPKPSAAGWPMSSFMVLVLAWAMWRADVADERLELFGAGDEVGFAVDFDHHADIAFAVDVRRNQAFLRGRPAFFAAERCPSCEGIRRLFRNRPKSPMRAFLQSIMPAPVFSRRSFTDWLKFP